MTIQYLLPRVAIALVVAYYVGWPLLKLLWRLIKGAWPFLKATWGGVLRAFARNPVTFIVTMALFAALGAAMAGLGPLPKLLFRPEPDKTTWAAGATYVGMRLGVAVAVSLLLTPMLVAVHRTILADRVQGRWFACARNYFGWQLVLQIGITLSFGLALLASEVAFVRYLIDFIMQIAIIIVAGRLLLLPPAVAIGVPARSTEARLDDSWMAMEGHFWTFVRLMLFTLLPMVVLLVVFSRLGLPRPPNPPPISPPPPAPPPVTKMLLIGRGLHGVVEAFAAALAASAASVFYTQLKPKD